MPWSLGKVRSQTFKKGNVEDEEWKNYISRQES